MPRSKRARVVHTSKVTKNRKERVSNLLANVQAAVEAYDSIWVFDVQNMRNNFLKEIRSELSDSRYAFVLHCYSFPVRFAMDVPEQGTDAR